jgi:hypothetical protein
LTAMSFPFICWPSVFVTTTSAPRPSFAVS